MSERSPLIHGLQCIACAANGFPQLQRTEEHHLNSGGNAGQKRRGDAYSIPLCSWHHRGEPPEGFNATPAYQRLGPSLARQSKQFRERYGSDDTLLKVTNATLKARRPHVAPNLGRTIHRIMRNA